MSFCNKLTHNKPAINIDLLKEYLAMYDDNSQDNLLKMYASAAVNYIEKTYDIALSINTYLCKYDNSYINRHFNKYSGKVEFELISPLDKVLHVRLIKNTPKFAHNSIIPQPQDFIELPFCVLDNKAKVNYGCLCNCGCDYIEIECMAGYLSIPDDILMAIYQMVGIMEQKGECDCAGAAKTVGVSQLLMPYSSIL